MPPFASSAAAHAAFRVALEHTHPWSCRDLAVASCVCTSWLRFVNDTPFSTLVLDDAPPLVVARLLARHARTVEVLVVGLWSAECLPRSPFLFRPLSLPLLSAVQERAARADASVGEWRAAAAARGGLLCAAPLLTAWRTPGGGDAAQPVMACLCDAMITVAERCVGRVTSSPLSVFRGGALVAAQDALGGLLSSRRASFVNARFAVPASWPRREVRFADDGRAAFAQQDDAEPQPPFTTTLLREALSMNMPEAAAVLLREGADVSSSRGAALAHNADAPSPSGVTLAASLFLAHFEAAAASGDAVVAAAHDDAAVALAQGLAAGASLRERRRFCFAALSPYRLLSLTGRCSPLRSVVRAAPRAHARRHRGAHARRVGHGVRIRVLRCGAARRRGGGRARRAATAAAARRRFRAPAVAPAPRPAAAARGTVVSGGGASARPAAAHPRSRCDRRPAFRRRAALPPSQRPHPPPPRHWTQRRRARAAPQPDGAQRGASECVCMFFCTLEARERIALAPSLVPG